MKYIYSLLVAVFFQIIALAQVQTIVYSLSPTTFNEGESVTITLNGSTVNEASWGITDNSLYIWAWSFDTATNTSADCPTNGTWTSSGAANKFTYNSSSDTYTFTFVPTTFFNRTGLSKMGFLIKAKDGTGDKKTPDNVVNIGSLQFSITTPAKNSTTFANSGSFMTVYYTTSLPCNWVLTANGVIVQTVSNSSSFIYSHTLTSDSNMQLTATSVASGNSISSSFNFLLTPVVQNLALPSYMRQGINYSTDGTKVGLALYAPLKSFVHVLGSFNNYNINANYLMNRDTTNPDLYWIEITGLTPQQVYTFQYRTNDGVKVADPFSRLVLSPDDDPYINASTYPNLPPYPAGQQYDVSVIQTAMPSYSWQVNNFVKPSKQNLFVYELLVRDFTSQQNWQSLIDKIDYFKSLNINAIELMPIMEFDGNNSWGYNTSFHFALDKAYGTSDKLKEFIDLCHSNGIAVILDIALNHATGRNPLERLWSTSTNGGYGNVAANNPYFNQNATHSYSVFYDFNHSKPATQNYVQRVLEQWINEYKIDGFRWDLTKGFTQACTSSDDTCTNNYQADRVAILKQYADYQWSLDNTSYVIFEHLGTDFEEQQWANYRLSEGKGIMTWDKMTDNFNQNTMGFASSNNISRLDFENHSFSERRNVSYGESHDEERLMFKNLTYGNNNGTTYDVKNLNTALQRMQAFGAVFLPVPGPKMIWQFGELGFDKSIYRCSNGINNFPGDTDGIGDCKLDAKPSAFTLLYDTDPNRLAIKNDWAKMINIKKANSVFDTTTFTLESSNGNLTPKIYIWKDALPVTDLKNVVILANFNTTVQNVIPNFPYTGTWVNLMDNTTISVSNTSSPIILQPGEYRIFGNQQASILGTIESIKANNEVTFYIKENPVKNKEAIFTYTNAKNGIITIFDFNGKLISKTKTNSNSGEQSINISNLPTGNYIVQLSSEKGEAVVKMIVK